jgi:eukaryotic-like serine/threonine-protein kinase
MAERIGKYEVIRPLGKGATATVYLARDPDSDLEVAVKLIRLDNDNAAMRRRLAKLFQIETQVARRLNHPNIVKVFDAVVEDKRAYIVMEYVKGQPMDEFCTIDKMLPIHRVIGIVFKCCMALDHAYKMGVIHRDIKPANILLGEGDNPKLSDFGLALFLGKNSETDSTFIQGVGSPAYMSPEQIKSYPLNQKTDLYSMGVVLFQLLTGRLPFRAPNHAALMYKIINTATPSAVALNPNLPPNVDRILTKALEKDLYSRYQNGAEFAKELTTVRFQLVDELTSATRDQERFSRLRRMPFFLSFEDIELWETLRFCVWRNVAEKVTLMVEGEQDRRFGIIVAGSVEVSTEGRVLTRLGVGEVVGEIAYLHPDHPHRTSTVVTLEPTEYLEINAAALDLSSEEVVARFHKVLLTTVFERFQALNKLVAAHAAPAVEGGGVGSGEFGFGFDLKLEPLDI